MNPNTNVNHNNTKAFWTQKKTYKKSNSQKGRFSSLNFTNRIYFRSALFSDNFCTYFLYILVSQKAEEHPKYKPIWFICLFCKWLMWIEFVYISPIKYLFILYFLCYTKLHTDDGPWKITHFFLLELAHVTKMLQTLTKLNWAEPQHPPFTAKHIFISTLHFTPFRMNDRLKFDFSVSIELVFNLPCRLWNF